MSRYMLKLIKSKRLRWSSICIVSGLCILLMGELTKNGSHNSEYPESVLKSRGQRDETSWHHLGSISGLQANRSTQTSNKINSELLQKSMNRTGIVSQPSDGVAPCDQNSRQATLHQACDWARVKGLDSAAPWNFRFNNTFRYLFVDDVHKVIYCEVPKAACTSWKSFFAILSGKVHPKDYTMLPEYVHNTDYYPVFNFKYLKDYSHQDRMYRLKNYFKFMIVRNPFSRLVSAYEDKFMHDTGQWYPLNIGPYITKYYRMNKTNENIKNSKDVKFEELVRFMLNDKERMNFKFDPHWAMMQNQCFPCLIEYDYIGKLETLEYDLNYLLDKFPTDANRPPFPFMNSNPRKSVNITMYYERLSKNEMLKLKKYYNIDSRMFGYSMHGNHQECH